MSNFGGPPWYRRLFCIPVWLFLVMCGLSGATVGALVGLALMVLYPHKAHAQDAGMSTWSDVHPSNNGGIDEQMQDARDYDNQEGKYAEPEDDDDDGE